MASREFAFRESSFHAAKQFNDWQDLEAGSEYDEVMRRTGFVEAVGDLHMTLREEFGGTFEHVRVMWFDFGAIFASQFAAVHQRYRWYPPVGTRLVNGHDLGERFLAALLEAGPGGEAGIQLCDECGIVVPPGGPQCARYIALERPSGERYLLIIGLPSAEDLRHERVPWLNSVVRSDFLRVAEDLRDVAKKAWTTAWRDTVGSQT